MSVSYQAVGWNGFKKRYDLLLWAGILLYLALFAVVSLGLNPALTIEILLIRATGTAGIFLLHVILAVGPLARLDAVNGRHDAVQEFFDDRALLADLRGACDDVRDIERLITRIGSGGGNARDLNAIGRSLSAVPALKD